MSPKVTAIVFINLYCILDTADNINVKIAMEKKVSVMDLALARIGLNFLSAIGFVYFCKKHVINDVSSNFKYPLTYRSIMLLLGQILNVYAISLMPLSIVTIIQNTQAFWTAILAYYINREAFYAIEGIGILACFVGVIMIAMAGDDHEKSEGGESVMSADSFLTENEATMRAVGIVAMLFVALNDASLNVLARKMKDLHYSLIQFWFSAIGLAFLIVYLVLYSLFMMDWPSICYYSWDQMKFLIMTGVFSALNLTCLVIAYQNDKSATVSLLAYIALVYAFVADVTIFNLSFVTMEILGCLIITFFNIITILYKMKYAPDDDEEDNGEKKDYQVVNSDDSDTEMLVSAPRIIPFSTTMPKSEADEWLSPGGNSPLSKKK